MTEIEPPCYACNLQPVGDFKCKLFDACKALIDYQSEKKSVTKISNVELELMRVEELFEIYFKTVQECAHQTAEDKGQWADVVSIHDVIAHVHCEVSELFKAINNGGLVSRNIPCFTHREEEAADVILLIMSMAEQLDWDLAGAIVAKAKYNLTRDRT